MGSKKKSKQIQTKLRAVSVDSLSKAVSFELNIPDPEESPDLEGMSDSSEWAGPSPPHIIDGQLFEEREKARKNGNTH